MSRRRFKFYNPIGTPSGKTEFGGIPTRTCLALGPDRAEKIDAVTGNLELY